MIHDQERLERMKPVLDRIPDEWGKSLPGPGWDQILLDLDRRLAEIDPRYTILQAKEKFGTLRVYFQTTRQSIELNDMMRHWVWVAERYSETTCEECGADHAKARHSGWIKTLCDDCEARRWHPTEEDDEQKAWRQYQAERDDQPSGWKTECCGSDYDCICEVDPSGAA